MVCFRTVIVDEVRDSDAKQRALKAGIQATQALALDNALDGLQGVGVGLLGLDLGSGGEGDQGVSAFRSQLRGSVIPNVYEMSRAGTRTSEPLTTILLPRQPARARHCRSAARR